MLDGVFNHAGDGFWAFRDVIERGPQSPYWNWFFIEQFPIVREPPSYQTCGGAPYLPKLNTSDPALRRYLLDVAVHWIERAGIDGWRLDVPWKVPLEFWAEFHQAVKRAKPDAYLVGEIWHSWERWLEVFDGLMNYRLRGHLHDFCLREAFDAEDLAHETAAYLRDAPSGGLMLNLLGSHDTPRLLTLAGGDRRRAILALAALFTYPGDADALLRRRGRPRGRRRPRLPPPHALGQASLAATDPRGCAAPHRRSPYERRPAAWRLAGAARLQSGHCVQPRDRGRPRDRRAELRESRGERQDPASTIGAWD